MQIKCLQSNSDGNCFVLTDNAGQMLLLDCGIPIKAIKEGINFNIKNLKGAVISHVHKDHSRAEKDLKFMGVKIFKPYSLAEKPARVTTQIDGFIINAFRHEDREGKLLHTNADGSPCECFGFYITHKDVPGWNLLYITDTEYCMYKFSNLQNAIIGTNYSKEKLMQNVTVDKRIYHTLAGHMSIENVCRMIEVNKPQRNVILSHLSLLNADAIEFKAMAEKVSQCPVTVATKGVEINL